MKLLIVFTLVGISSWALTGVLRRYATAKSLMDVPNTRSSHSIPTPRGGGLAIVITFLSGLIILWALSQLESVLLIALFGAGSILAFIGFIDDRGHIAARWRLLAHFLAAGWLLYWIDGVSLLNAFESVYLTWFVNIFALVGVVWFLNLYNFMDGIDGIAGIEALSSTLVSGAILVVVFDYSQLAYLYILLLVAVAGFLIWNFPPAKIFMGDAGSGFLGIILGGFALHSIQVSVQLFWAWVILLGVFIVDATYTLTRRLIQGEKVYQAHRSHAYQYASRKYNSHRAVTISVLAINTFWLAPWAVATTVNLVDGPLAVLMAFVPLVFLAWYYHAGEKESSK